MDQDRPTEGGDGPSPDRPKRPHQPEPAPRVRFSNPLYRDDVFPDPVAIFAFRRRPLKDVLGTCLVVLDTNVLKIPYMLDQPSLDAISKVYGKLRAERRLIVPAQVAREFAALRPRLIMDMSKTWSDLLGRLGTIKNYAYPILDRLPGYREFAEVWGRTITILEESRESIRKLMGDIRSFHHEDPVTALYAGLFDADVILGPASAPGDLLKEHKVRAEHRIPPGYQDGGKEDGGIGDFLIWKTILAAARDGRDTLFVTAEEKNDWVHAESKTLLSPRVELVEEYRRESGGGSFHVVKLAELLDAFGTKEEVVAKVVAAEHTDAAGPEKPRPVLATDAITRSPILGAGMKLITSFVGRLELYNRDGGTRLRGRGYTSIRLPSNTRKEPIYINVDEGRAGLFRITRANHVHTQATDEIERHLFEIYGTKV